MYQVKVSFNLDKICKKLPLKDKEMIFRALKVLESHPRPVGAIKLSGREGYRVRVGNYRILYQIKDKELLVVVIDINDRREVYKKR
jgi:mRNA interferase RelE/StbE